MSMCSWPFPTVWLRCRSTCGTTSWESVPTTRKIELALALEAQARGADPRIRQVSSADYGDVAAESALVSTTGIRSSTRKTSGYLSVGVIAGEGDASQTGGGFSVGRGFDGLDPERATTDAVSRAVRLLGAVKGPSGRSTIVFDRRMATTLLSIVSSALSGEAVAKGRSIFAGRVGEQVGHPGLTLVDDPTDPRAYGAAAYDSEGLACRRNALIEGGVLRGFLYDTVSGSRSGVASTGSAVRGGYAGTPGPGCRALTLAPGPEGYDEDGVLAAVGEGLFVQSMTGVHSGVNPISGDFSVGAEGLMIRDGKLAEPVREITVPPPCSACCCPWWRWEPTSSGSPVSPPARHWPLAICRSAAFDPRSSPSCSAACDYLLVASAALALLHVARAFGSEV